MKERKDITLDTSVMDLMTTMCEGNIGALNVIMELVKQDPDKGVFWLLHLDDMNIRGSQIWIGFKYYCGQDMNRFIECIKTRDEGMIAKINEMNEGQGDRWKAVRHGASERQTARPTFQGV